jgi:hypothetical protein
LDYLLRHTWNFRTGGRVESEPNEVVLARDDWLGTDNDNNIITRFQNVYEITNNINDFVKSSDVERFIKNLDDISYKKFAMELKKHCSIKLLTNVRNGDKKINKKSTAVWFGVRDINNSIDDDDITEEL